jgi:hypothetical protein
MGKTGYLWVFVLFVMLAIGSSQGQTCPDYTKKTAIEGSTAALPKGFCLFYINGKKGLYRSPVNGFSATMVPNTENDNPRTIEISDDGEWVVYVNDFGINESGNHGVIMRIDGSSRKTFSVTGPDPPGTDHTERTSSLLGFWRNSPGKNEVFFVTGPFTAFATSINISGSQAEIGATRKVFELPRLDLGIINFWPGSTAAFNGDQFFIPEILPLCTDNPPTLPAYFTIPSQGAGIAGSADRYVFSDEACKVYGSCGVTMSHDGQYCATNSGTIGGLCVPTKDFTPDLDHKGFMITRFMKKGTPPVKVDEVFLDPRYGVSSNFCPLQYQRALWDEVNFDKWYFSNDNRYLIGSLTGSKLTQYGLKPGLWIVHWPANTWTRITPADNTQVMDEPAVHFELSSDTNMPKVAAAGKVVASRSVVRAMPCEVQRLVDLHNGRIRAICVRTLQGRIIYRQAGMSTISGMPALPQFAANNMLLLELEIER